MTHASHGTWDHIEDGVEQLLHEIDKALYLKDMPHAVDLMSDLAVDHPAVGKALALRVKKYPELARAIATEIESRA